MLAKNMYDKGCIITRENEYGQIDFEKGESFIKEITDKASIILVIDDKSYESTLGIISTIKAQRSLILLDTSNVVRQLEIILNNFKPRITISSKKTIEKIFNQESINYSLFNYKKHEYLNSNKVGNIKRPLVLIGTSGTSGNPKLVGLTHENISTNCSSIINYLNTNRNTKTINNLPCSYSYGLSVLNTTLASGGKFHISTEPSHIRAGFWEEMKYFGITDFSGVPTIYQDINSLKLIECMPKTLKCLTQAGGKLDIQTQKEILKWSDINKVRFFIMYGQTEATARLTYLELTKEPEKLGSVGRTIEGIDLFNEKYIKKNKEFELIFKGPSISLGYYFSYKDIINSTDKNQGILKTGDIGYLDEDNCLYITGRTSRFAKIDGRRISLDEIESKMKEKFNNLAIVSDDKLIFLILEDQNFNDFNNIKKYCKLISGIHTKKIKVLIQKIPMTESGKIMYSVLKKRIYEDI